MDSSPYGRCFVLVLRIYASTMPSQSIKSDSPNSWSIRNQETSYFTAVCSIKQTTYIYSGFQRRSSARAVLKRRKFTCTSGTFRWSTQPPKSGKHAIQRASTVLLLHMLQTSRKSASSATGLKYYHQNPRLERSTFMRLKCFQPVGLGMQDSPILSLCAPKFHLSGKSSRCTSIVASVH